jgi:plasmid stabilization system protein ParE
MKPTPVEYDAGARADIRQVVQWYSDHDPALAAQFLSDLEESIERVSLFPESRAIGDRDMRTCVLRRFPYIVYYDYDGTRVNVLVVAHGSRAPGFWNEQP